MFTASPHPHRTECFGDTDSGCGTQTPGGNRSGRRRIGILGGGVAGEEEVARIFEPFYGPDRSRSRETGGSGLDRAIVKSRIEACGGTANAENMPGGGFAVSLVFQLEQGIAGQILHN